ncbi:50S ribosomal protein L32 [bacterium]|nr:50S ribosomal protein L32 [bacterium]
MPPPKRRHSNARTRSRRTHWKATLPGVTKCNNCSEVILSHVVCPSCGFYGGKQIVAKNS